MAAGGNDVRLNGLELGFADPAAVYARAREAAWQDALATAGHFASLAGASPGHRWNPSVGIPVTRRQSRSRKCSGPPRWSRSGWRRENPASAPLSTSSGNWSTEPGPQHPTVHRACRPALAA